MNRKSFSRKLALLGVCPFVIQNLSGSELRNFSQEQDEKLKAIQAQKQFIENWLADLLESMDKNLDRETQERIVGNCGKACFSRFQFKRDIAINGTGDLDKLITELLNPTIFTANARELLTRLSSRQHLAKHSGLRLLKVCEEVEKPAISLCI